MRTAVGQRVKCEVVSGGHLQLTDVQSALHELDEGLDIVGLGTDRADDGGLRECERELAGLCAAADPPCGGTFGRR